MEDVALLFSMLLMLLLGGFVMKRLDRALNDRQWWQPGNVRSQADEECFAVLPSDITVKELTFKLNSFRNSHTNTKILLLDADLCCVSDIVLSEQPQ